MHISNLSTYSYLLSLNPTTCHTSLIFSLKCQTLLLHTKLIFQKKAIGMEQGATSRNTRFSAHDKRVLAIGLAVIAILSPLYIDRRSNPEPELEEEAIYVSSYIPLLQLVLIMAIVISVFLERGFTGLDPYWIHRVGGSSTGIIIVLIILTFVLKWKAY